MIVFDQKLLIYYSTKINDNNFFSGFGTRALGNTLPVSYEKIVVPEQVHGDSVKKLDTVFFSAPVGTPPSSDFVGEASQVAKKQVSSLFYKVKETDGLITSQKNTALTIVTADCVPIIFADKKTGMIGISHQGWRGTLKKLAYKMVKRLIKEGSNKNDIIAAIGPAIGECCYDMNLTKLNYFQLLDSGIKKENIDYFPFCTSCQKDKFYSYRRDKTDLRQLSFIVLSK